MVESKIKLGIIKVCPNPQCEAVWHNCPIKHTRCNDCGGWVIKINEETFWKKFSGHYFQYDTLSGEYFRPVKEAAQLEIELDFNQ